MKNFQSLIPGILVAGSLLAVQAASAQSVGDVFVIEMENHNLTQPASVTSPRRCWATRPPRS